MALDERYILSAPITQVFLDKDTGLALANGTLEFFRNDAQSTPKTVYELTGTPGSYVFTALPNPITLSSTGQIQNASGTNVALYLFPYDDDDQIDLYYISCKSAGGVEQFTRQAWPNLTAGTDPTKDPYPVTNQIANPQFSRFFVNAGTNTFAVTGSNQTFKFAPDWEFEMSGSGSVSVAVTAKPGNDNIITNPPYVVDITVPAGVTSCLLRQRMNTNSGLWSGTSESVYLNASMVAKNNNVGDVSLLIFYAESTGGSPTKIFDQIFGDSGFTRASDSSTLIPTSTNTDTGADGYIDIYISIPEGANVSLSSVQVVPTTSALTSTDIFSYDNQTSNREQALMGDYFIPALSQKPIPSLLIGWDFPLNPRQFGGASQTMNNVASTSYLWDQTIGAVESGGTANTITANSTFDGFNVATGAGAESCYIAQYLDGPEAKKFLGTKLSVNVHAFKATGDDQVTMRVYLLRGSSAATFPTLPTGLFTLNNDGTITSIAANWTEINRGGLPVAQADLNPLDANNDINSTQFDHGFNSWEIIDNTQIGDTDKIAVVVTFRYATVANNITVQSISCVPGDIPTRPAPQERNAVWRECQKYYEKSYLSATATGTGTSVNALLTPQVAFNTGAAVSFMPSGFMIDFESESRTSSPTVTVYNESTGTSGEVFAVIYSATGNNSGNVAIATYYGTSAVNQKRAIYYPANTSVPGITHANTGAGKAWITYHYQKEDRIGI